MHVHTDSSGGAPINTRRAGIVRMLVATARRRGHAESHALSWGKRRGRRTVRILCVIDKHDPAKAQQASGKQA